MEAVGKVSIRRRTLDILLDIIEEFDDKLGELTPAEQGAIKQAYEALAEGNSNSPVPTEVADGNG